MKKSTLALVNLDTDANYDNCAYWRRKYNTFLWLQDGSYVSGVTLATTTFVLKAVVDNTMYQSFRIIY